ncbi:MAG: hypothetical protein AB8B53_06975 [Flavobacteriales bacterium]
MIIKALLNHQDTLDLMFHTAAGDMSVTKLASERLTSVRWEGNQDVNSWGGSSEARFSQNNSLAVESFSWDSLSLWEFEHSGHGTDGKFGPHLFDGKAIEISFSQNSLFILDSLPSISNDYFKAPLKYENGMMFITGMSSINGEDHENAFLIHSGYAGSILYDDSFTQESKIGEYIEITDEQKLKDSAGNELKTFKGKLPKFTLAGKELEDLTVGFFEGTIGRQQMSVVGGELLKRFDWIIDIERENVYLKPI